MLPKENGPYDPTPEWYRGKDRSVCERMVAVENVDRNNSQKTTVIIIMQIERNG